MIGYCNRVSFRSVSHVSWILRTINALKGALSIDWLAEDISPNTPLLTSLLDNLGTGSLGVVRADNTVKTVL